jgi:hypothetical protein
MRSGPLVTITAALAADLDVLTAALDEPGTDLADTLHRLAANAAFAIPTYLGLSVTVSGSVPPFAFTSFHDGVVAGDVRTSLRLTLPSGGGAGARQVVTLVLYAGSPGTFVDLASDLAWLSGRPSSDFALDQHLQSLTERVIATGLLEASTINQAIGVLIGKGHTPEEAEEQLTSRTVGAGISRHAVALRILAGLTS